MSSWSAWRGRLPWIIVAVALLLRLGFAASQGIARPVEPGSDELEYDTYAWNLATGQGYRGMSPDVSDQNHLTAYRSPGPSLVYAAIYQVAGHRIAAVRVFNCIVGALACLLIVTVGRRTFGETTGLVAGAIWACWPVAIFLSGTLLSDQLATVTLLGLVIAVLAFGSRPTLVAAGLSGLLLGVVLIVHPSRVFLLPMLGLWALVQFRTNFRALLTATVMPLVALLVIVPWVVRNERVFHRFIPFSTMGGSVLLQGNNRITATDPEYLGYNIWDTEIPEYRDALRAPNDEFGRDSVAKSLAMTWLAAHRDRWLPMAVAKLRRGWTPFLQSHTARIQRVAMLMSWGPILLLFVIGFIPTLWRFIRHRQPGWLLHMVILHMVALDLVFFGLARYRLVVEPYCILIAVGWVVALFSRRWSSGPTQGATAAAV